MIVDVFGLGELSGCQAIAATSPGNGRYIGDCCIRFWAERSWAQLAGAVGIEADEFIINGGIGTLTVRRAGNDMLPTPTIKVTPAPRVAAEESARRADLCRACPQYRPGSDICGRCGCGFVIADRINSAHSRCPDGIW